MKLQLFFNILYTSSTFVLMALSFYVIYRIIHFFHFAHAVVFTSGAYFAFLLNIILGFSLWLSFPLAIIYACLLGCFMEISVYKPLRKRNASAIIMLLASSARI